MAPFCGNIIELCPVGALTYTAYRFRARPWDIEDAGSVCTLARASATSPSPSATSGSSACSRATTHEVDDGWLCDKGRWGYQAAAAPERITEPLVRDGGHLRPVSWERALTEAVERPAQGRRCDRRAGRRTAPPTKRPTCSSGSCARRSARRHLDSRPAGLLEPATARLLARPRLAASVSDIDRASVVLVLESDPMNEAPILDLRVRKAVRRNGTKLVVAGSRPTALDGGAAERLTCAPGSTEALLRAIQKALVDLEETGDWRPETGEERRRAAGGRRQKKSGRRRPRPQMRDSRGRGSG